MFKQTLRSESLKPVMLRKTVIPASMLLTALILVFSAGEPVIAQEPDPVDQPSQTEPVQPDAKQQRRQERIQKRQDAETGQQQEKPGAGKRRRGMPPQGAAQDVPPVAADAAGQARRIAQMLKRIDANGDGRIARDEAPERLRNQWDRIDANGDGQIDRQELIEVIRAMGQRKAGNRKNPQAGDKPPASDVPRNDAAPPNAKTDRKKQKKMREPDQQPEGPSGGGSVEPVRPGKGG